jgi:hypothetical protein
MITETPPAITCFISKESEILHDHTARYARAPRSSPAQSPRNT